MGSCLRLSVWEKGTLDSFVMGKSDHYGKIGSLYLMHQLCLDDQSEKQSALIPR